LKKLKTILTGLTLAASIFFAAGTVGAEEVSQTDGEPTFTTTSIASDPGTGGGGK
jgi:hypothetical protein